MGRGEGKSQSLWNDIKFKKKLNNIEDYNKGKSKKRKCCKYLPWMLRNHINMLNIEMFLICFVFTSKETLAFFFSFFKRISLVGSQDLLEESGLQRCP